MGFAQSSASPAALLALSRALPSGSVRTDRESCEAFARDESEAVPTIPSAVVSVSSTEEVARAMRVAFEHDVAVTPRAGGTGRTGGAVPQVPGWVLAFERWTGIDAIDRDDLIATVRPGTVLQTLHEAVEAEGLFYPPDANSQASCTIGGNIAENAGGPRAFKYGVTGDYVLGLEAVLPDGTVLEAGRRTKKGVTGYDITSLLVGSEGTLALVTRATLRLIAKPEAVRCLAAFFDDVSGVAPAIAACLHARHSPRVLELLDAITLDVLREEKAMAIPENARAMLLVELDGDGVGLDRSLEQLGGVLVDAGALEVSVAANRAQRDRLWAARREMSRALRKRAVFKLSEDVVVPRSQIGALLSRVRELSDEHECVMPTYGHAGDGNLHVNFLWNTDDELPRVHAAIEGLFRATLALGGTLTGEHGIGVLKAPFLPLEQSPELIALQRRIKAQFDPKGILNPGKIFPRNGHGAC